MADGQVTIKDLTGGMHDIDDSYMLGTLLYIKKAKQTLRLYKQYTQAKRAKTESDTPYDRYLLFRDTCTTSGSCFVMMFESADEFRKFYHDTNMCVGDVIRIAELFGVISYVSSSHDLPVVRSNLLNECERIDKVNYGELVKDSEICEPQTGRTLSFRISGKTLTITGARMVATDCRGDLCDRQKKTCS